MTRIEKIKSLRRRVNEAESHAAELKEQSADISRLYQKARDTATHLRKKLDELESDCQELEVSDHALVRYCERVMGVDMEEGRRRLIAEIGDQWRVLGDNVTMPINGTGCRAVISCGKVVTVK